MAASVWTRPRVLRTWLLGTTALLPTAGALAQSVAPNTLPTGGQIAAGSATIGQSGAAMQVTQTTNRAAINWQSFNVGANARVNFQQPNAGSWTLNRVVGSDPSVIAGRMTANGGIAVVNQSGVVFAAGAQVNVGSLIASAANITNENFMAGRMVFDGPPKPGAIVENHGSITVADRGLAALVGPRAANSGTIRARLGRVALAGAETFSLDLAGDGLLSIDVTQAVRSAGNGATALVTNSGVIEAHGGTVLLSAHAASGLVEDLVRNTGSIAASTAAGRTGQVALRAEGGGVRVEGSITAMGGAAAQGGRIELRGSAATTVGATARVDASGGSGGGTVLVGTTGIGPNQQMSARTTVEAGARIRANARNRGNGGTIAVNSTTETVAKGSLSARGGRQGGDGGLVELSGHGSFDISASVDVSAPAGRRGGVLLDPDRIVVNSSANIIDPAAAGDSNLLTGGVTPVVASGSAGTLYIAASVVTTLLGSADLTLQADRLITFKAGAGSISNAGANLAHGLSLTVTTANASTPNTDGIFLYNSDIRVAALNISSRNGGTPTGTIMIDANLAATGNINIDGHNVIVSRSIYGQNVTLTAGGTLSNAGAIVAGTNLSATAGQNIRNGQGLLGGAADTSGAWMLAETGRLTLAATAGDVQNLGQMVTTASANTSSGISAATRLSNDGVILLGDPRATAATAGTVSAAEIDLGASGRIVAGSVAASASLGNAGQIGADSVAAGTTLGNSGTLVALTAASAGTTLSNSGTLNAPGIGAGGSITNTATGAIVADSLASTAGSVLNSGTISANTVTAQIDVQNAIATARINATTVTAETGDVTNVGGARIVSGRVNVSPLNFSLATTPVSPLTATAAEAMAFAGTPLGLAIAPTGGATASAAPGLISPGDLSLTAGGTLSNAGAIVAGTNLSATAGQNIRNGQGLLGGAADTSGAWMLAETGRLTLAATAGDVQNLGQMVTTASANTSSGISAATRLSNDGVILLGDPRATAATAGTVSAAEIDLGASGRIVAGSVAASASLGNAGQIGADSVAAGTTLGNSGTLVALTAASAGTTLSNSGTLNAPGIGAGGSITNTATGAIVADSLASTAGSVLNSGTISANTVTAQIDVQNAIATARINATTVTAETGDVTNVGGARIVSGRVNVSPLNFSLATTPVSPLTATAAEAMAFAGTPLGLAIAPTGGATASAAPGLISPGDLSLTAGGTLSNAGAIVAGTNLSATAGGNMVINGTASAPASLSANGNLVVTAGRDIILRNVQVAADVASFVAGRASSADYTNVGTGTLTNDGVNAAIGTAILFAAPSGIADIRSVVVSPRRDLLPAVLYDSRSKPVVNPLSQVLPDYPGLVANQQPTLVRSRPGSHSSGAFGLPNQNTPAGNMAVNVNAGRSAVFLLVDGGNIQGNIIAGRLGVHGAGGTMSLSGTLNGLSGAEAARFGDVTRPIGAIALQKYRVNGCVISSINCVVPPSIQIMPIRLTDRNQITLENRRINTSEVLIPNVAETDYE